MTDRPARTHRSAAGRIAPPASAVWLALAVLALAPCATAQDEDFSLDSLFGGSVDLAVGKGGTIRWIRDADSGTLRSMVAKTKVTLRSDRFNIDCDTLTYDAVKNVILAVGTGKPVRIKRPGMTATCRHLRYRPEKDETVLTGNPIVTQKSGVIKGEKITIIQKDGNMELIVDSGGISGSGGSAKPTPIPKPKPKPKSKPTPVPPGPAEPTVRQTPPPNNPPVRARPSRSRKALEMSVDEDEL